MTSPIWGQYDDAPTVEISGKVKNFDPKDLEIYIEFSRAGFFRESAIRTNMDENGNFKTSFKTFTPTEFLVCYKLAPIFTASVYPKDNIYIESFSTYKENMTNPVGILFKGSSAKFNREIFIFKKMIFNNNFNPYKPEDIDWVPLERFTPNAYAKFLKDTVLVKYNKLFKEYIRTNNPSVEAIKWCEFNYKFNEYYKPFSQYPSRYSDAPLEYMSLQQRKKLRNSRLVEIPLSYYDTLTELLPIKNYMFLNGIALSEYIHEFDLYISEKTLRPYKGKINYVYDSLEMKNKILNDVFLLRVAGIKKYVKDPLLKQMLLANILVDGIYCTEKLESFKKYESSIINQEIKEVYLKKHLYYIYEKAKKVVEERNNEKKITMP